MSNGTITHVAGALVRFNQPDLVTTRQRCAWCGTLLIEYVGPPFPIPEGIEPIQQTWELYTLLRVDGPNIEPLEISDLPPGIPELPDDSCFKIDQEVTR